MEVDALTTLIVLLVTLVALARDLLPPPATVLGAVVVLLVLGVVTPAQAFVGFSNPAPVTVAALYVLARAVEKTGALQPLVQATLGREGPHRAALLRLVGAAGAASSVFNNTPVVAMLVPQVSDWAERRGQSPSRYLMPLSFATMLGGVVTTVGTSTNLVISGLLEASGEPPWACSRSPRWGSPWRWSVWQLSACSAPSWCRSDDRRDGSWTRSSASSW